MGGGGSAEERFSGFEDEEATRTPTEGERERGGEIEGSLFRGRKKEKVSLEMGSTVIRGSCVYGGRGALNTLDKSRPPPLEFTHFAPHPLGSIM